jgi:hypothetical protein
MEKFTYTEIEIATVIKHLNRNNLSTTEYLEFSDKYLELCLNLTKNLAYIADYMFEQKYRNCEQEQREFDYTYLLLRRMRDATEYCKPIEAESRTA